MSWVGLTAVLGLMVHSAIAQVTPTPAAPAFEQTHWRATELAGKPVSAPNPKQEPYVQFQAAGRVSGSDGCNRFTGTYELKGNAITFGRLAGTRIACAQTAEIERAFHDAIGRAARWAMTGQRLELFDASGSRVALLEAQTQTPPARPSSLEGTRWQLVQFQGSDDTTRKPDDKSKYTIEFGAGGRLTVRFDCNQGRGTWKSSGPNQMAFGPLATTRAACPPGSLHDQMAKQWGTIRSYVIRDGHLFLALMADGGIYEFEPVAPAR
jgi:heat shock protein HslJ